MRKVCKTPEVPSADYEVAFLTGAGHNVPCQKAASSQDIVNVQVTGVCVVAAAASRKFTVREPEDSLGPFRSAPSRRKPRSGWLCRNDEPVR
jgi:hypothetical protein